MHGLVFILPFTLLTKLQLRCKTKIAVYAVLMLGLIDLTFSFTRFAQIEMSAAQGDASVTLICKSSTSRSHKTITNQI